MKRQIKFYKKYVDSYYRTFGDKLFFDIYKIQKVIEEKINNNSTIFVCGNGGSAAVSNHFICDYKKSIKLTSKKKKFPKFLSLTNSIELITAISNDQDYSKIFSEQIENFCKKGDCLIILSCSGNSKNVLEVSKIAKKKKLFIISLVGFNSNSKLKKNSNIYLNLNIKNYGISEDIFQSIMHMISQNIRLNLSSHKKDIL